MGDSVFSFLFLSCSWRMFLVFLALGGPWGEGVSGHLTITAQAGVCVISYLFTATCGPKGHGSGMPLPSRTAAGFYQTISCPRSK